MAVAAGVALMIRARFGVAPYDVLTTGLAERTGLAVGAAAVVLPATFVAVGLALGGRAGVGTAITTAGVGPVLALALAVVPDVDAVWPRLGLFAVGAVLVAGGITAVIVAELGPGPAELVMLAIHGKGLALVPVRTGIELTCFAVGWLLGGQVGVGTAVFAFAVGPMLRRMLAAAGWRSPESAETRIVPGTGI